MDSWIMEMKTIEIHGIKMEFYPDPNIGHVIIMLKTLDKETGKRYW